MIHLYNTMSGQLEPFEPLEPGRVSMYVCGPTVYGLLHIGNGRTFMFWDVARRYLRYRGYEVTFVQNFTDIDDKIIEKAQEEGTDAAGVAEKYTQAFFEDMAALGVAPADCHPRATETVGAMIAFIQGLIAKDMAYAREGDVYYRVRRFPGYGKLSGRTPDQLRAGARVEVAERKDDPLDFALWKRAKPGEPAWESPWGPGRPGWHIECSAMVKETLGTTIDIHAGGMDLKFPHHENEIAQSEAFTGEPFVRYWMHTGFLNMEAEKMSKSLGNVKTIRDAVATYGAQAVRVFLLGTLYRQELDFSDAAIRSAWAGFRRLRKTLAAWAGADAPAEGVAELVTEARAGFTAAMDHDFNTPRAIAHFNEWASRLRKLALEAPGMAAGFGPVVDELKDQAAILGLDLNDVPEPVAALEDDLSGALLDLLIDLRKEAKAQKNWALADMVRDRLTALGIRLKDNKDGTTAWEKADAVTA